MRNARSECACLSDVILYTRLYTQLIVAVTVPPEKIAILNEKSIALGTSAGPYLEGDELKLYCDVHGGKYLLLLSLSLFLKGCMLSPTTTTAICPTKAL